MTSKNSNAFVTTRVACKQRHALDGVDAQALEHALTITERERDDLLAQLRSAQDELEQWKDASGLECGGDPDSVTPEKAQAYWERIEKIATGTGWLPEVLLTVRGGVFEAYSDNDAPVSWGIRAEAESITSARTRITLSGRIMSDITIHALHESQLAEEVQEQAAGLLWSALRAMALRNPACVTRICT